MPKLHINLAPVAPTSTARLITTTLCGALLLISAWQFTERDRLLTAINDAEHQSSRLERQQRLQQGQHSSPPTDPKVEQEIQGIAKQLTVPWLNMLSSVAEHRQGDIALTKIEPQAQTQTVHIHGYATQQRALFAFMERLEQDEHWQSVLPQHQELNNTQPDKPLSFQLSAQWRGQP